MENQLVNTIAETEVIEVKEVAEKEQKNTKAVKTDVADSAIELRAQAERVLAKWKENVENFKIIWSTPEKLEEHLKAYGELLDLGINAVAERKAARSELSSLNKEIDEKIPIVKGYFNEIFDRRERTAHYSEVGIVRHNKSYLFPKTLEARKAAFPIMIAGLEKYGFANYIHGTEYWSGKENKFTELYEKSFSKSVDVSESSGGKAKLKKEIQKTLRALRALIKINYPETWKNQVRVWGFQRERK